MESIQTFIENYSLLVKIVVGLAGYFFTFWITNVLIKKIVLKGKVPIDANTDSKINETNKNRIRDGYIIGKCENIIILSFILFGEVTGLALIFAAKNLARQQDIKKDPGFFLAGTMVNFTATLVIAYGLKFLLVFIP